MRKNPLAGWRLRVGDVRVFFNIADDEKMVSIEAIGIKINNRVLIEDVEVEFDENC